nr:hypothetical protein [Tanacetum cinerariifolium]
MVLLNNQISSPNSVLDSKMLDSSSNDSHEELYLNDEEDDGDSMIVLQTPNKEVSISEGSYVTTIETYMETYKNVSQDIRDQLNAEAEAV